MKLVIFSFFHYKFLIMGNTYRELIKSDFYVPYSHEKYPF